MNIHWIYCIENIFTVQDFWETCACLQKQRFPAKYSLYWIYFLPFKIFDPALTLENKICPEIFHCIYFLHSRFLSNLRLPWFAVLNIYFLQWRAVRFVTGEALSLSKSTLRVYELNGVANSTTQLAACRMTAAYAFYPISQFVTHIEAQWGL